MATDIGERVLQHAKAIVSDLQQGVRMRADDRPSYAAALTAPCGSSTNFFATPLSNCW